MKYPEVKTEYDDYLRKVGCNKVEHVGGCIFDTHLKGTQVVLERWGAPKEVSTAGLFHSIYGTQAFQGFALGLSKRAEVRELIGERAERTAYINCVMDYTSLDALVSRAREPTAHKEIRARDELELAEPVIDLTEEQFLDLITMHLADWLEQVERQASKPYPKLGWEKAGDAYGFRRGAYRHMAELVGGPGLEEYDRIFAKEPPETRHLHQRTVPKQPLYKPPS